MTKPEVGKRYRVALEGEVTDAPPGTYGVRIEFDGGYDSWIPADAEFTEIAPPEPPLPEEPPTGAVVWDEDGGVYQSDSRGRWYCPGSSMYRTWENLYARCGPLTLMVPQREDAPEPVEAEPDWRPGDVVEDAQGRVFMRIRDFDTEGWTSTSGQFAVGTAPSGYVPVRPLRVLHRAGEVE